MNKWFLLLVVAGLAVAGWIKRDTVTGWIHQKMGTAAPAFESGNPSATPNPAPEAVAQARKDYPALAMAGSAFNLRFVALYNEMRASNPAFLARPNWPVQLAERTARELGGGAVPHAVAPAITGWTENYAAAVASAKSENKKLLLDFTGSDWCGYCKLLESEVWNSPKFQSWARDHVVLVRLDFPKHHSQSGQVKEQNARLQARYPSDSYPTVILADAAGNVLGRWSGYTPGSGPDAYLAQLQSRMR